MIERVKKYSLLTSLSLLIGLMVGMLTTFFGRVLLWIGEVREVYLFYLLPFLSLAGLLIVFFYQNFGGKASRGMGLIFQVGHGEEERIPKRLIPLVLLATWLTHLFGGSAGREGVAVQLGATVAHWFSRWFPEFQLSRILVVTGMAAGFAGLFQTPLAATFFALEVLVMGELFLPALYPSLLASLVASWTSYALGLEKFTYKVQVTLAWSPELLVKLVCLGIVFALCGKGVAYTLSRVKQLLLSYLPNPYLRIGVLGLILSVTFFCLGQGRYSGLGTNLISAGLTGQEIRGDDWFLKSVLTVLTLAAGYQGGEVTPLFAIGASLGVTLAGFVGLPLPFVAALGYVAVFASATSTLIGPILIGGEVFGFSNLPYVVVVCCIAFALKPNLSIYGGQKLAHARKDYLERRQDDTRN